MIKTWPKNERPREKLLTMGPNALSDAELLAILIKTGIKNKNALDIGREMLTEFSGLRGIFSASIKEISQISGLGPAKYALFQASLEIGKRHLRENLNERDVLKHADDTREYLTSRLRDYQHEVFACLFLDIRHRIISFDEMFHGTINEASVHPREVVKAALKHNAAAIIFAHNHPSGVSEPSYVDEIITQQLQRALALVNVKVIDHVVIGDGEYVSMAELGLI